MSGWGSGQEGGGGGGELLPRSSENRLGPQLLATKCCTMKTNDVPLAQQDGGSFLHAKRVQRRRVGRSANVDGWLGKGGGGGTTSLLRKEAWATPFSHHILRNEGGG